MLTFDICNFINFIFHWINPASSILSFMKLMYFFFFIGSNHISKTIDKYIISVLFNNDNVKTINVKTNDVCKKLNDKYIICMLFNNEKVKTINVKTNDVCKIKWKEIENSRFFVTTLLSDKIQVKIK